MNPQGASFPPPQGYPPPPPPAGYPPPQGGKQQGYPYAAPPPAYAQAGPYQYQQNQGPYQQGPSQYYAPQPQRPHPPPQRFDGYDVEAAQAAHYAAAFADQKIRSAFVRKVMVIVLIQLAFTVGVACVFLFVDPVHDYIQPGGGGQWVFWVGWILSLVIMIAIVCSSTLRRKHPWNLIALGLFTLAEAVVVGVICAYWTVDVVLIAFITTAAVVAGLTLVAMFMPFDITKYGFVLAMVGMAFTMLVFTSLIIGFFWRGSGSGLKWWYFAISIVGALLFSAYLIYDIQTLIGGKKVALSPDEYVYGSLTIYTDIIAIFLMILSIVGIASR